MLSTLILLYALDTGQIPTGCYVAAWVFTIIQCICMIIKFLKPYFKDSKTLFHGRFYYTQN